MEKYCPKCFNTYAVDATTCTADGSTLVGMEERDLIGEVLDGRYKILDLVGEGGMGVVYKAEQEIIGRVVALKVLRREIVRDASQVKRFLTEAKAIASLTSANTVTLYDFGVTSDGLLYYTMELLEGRSLGQIIDQDGPVPYPRAAEIMRQACDSLGEAHDSGILHRDIKPDNIFVSPGRGGGDAVKVLDFGIAKLMGDGSLGTLTQTGMICGTPAYLAPEQALGNPAGPSADLYSLAITLYEALAGVPPFRATTAMKLLLQHINEAPPPVTDSNPDVMVPASFEDFLRKALAKEPDERFTSVDQFREGLDDALRRQEEAPAAGRIPNLATTSVGTRVIADTGETTTMDVGTAETMVAQPTPGIGTETSSPRADLLTTRPSETPVDMPTAPGFEPGGAAVEAPRSTGSRLPWVVGVGFTAALAVALVIWQPWKGTEGPVAHPEAAMAKAPAEARPAEAAVAADPAAERARIDAEIEARVRAAEDAARRRVEAEAAQRAVAAEARSKADQETLERAVEAAATKAAADTRRQIEAEAALRAEETEAKAKAAAEEAARKKAEEDATKAAELAAAKAAADAAAKEQEAADEEARRAREAHRKAAAEKKAAEKKAAEKKAAEKKAADDGFVTIPADDPPKKDPKPSDDGFVTLPE